MAEKKLNLLADFPAVSTQEWMDKIIADLKGADFNRKLVWRTTEGFDVMPFYRAENLEGLETKDSAPGKFPYVRGTKDNNTWYVRQNIDASCASTANAKALEILDKGVNSIGFKLNKKELSADYIATLLNGIYADCVELNFTVCIRKCAGHRPFDIYGHSRNRQPVGLVINLSGYRGLRRCLAYYGCFRHRSLTDRDAEILCCRPPQ